MHTLKHVPRAAKSLEQLMDASEAWTGMDVKARVAELLSVEINISDAFTHRVVLAARLVWNEVRHALEITIDEVRNLVASDSPFGQGFRLAQPGLALTGMMGQAHEEVLASANTEDGDELRISPSLRGERINARFYGEVPPRLILSSETGERREYVWEQTREGWEVDLGVSSDLNGILTAEVD
jgi:hypothetical protein